MLRHPAWATTACFDILRQYNAALALTDWPGLRITDPLTADFVFVRRHGPAGLYSSNYSEAQLREDAKRIRAWQRGGRDVYLYFNNDVHGFAVKNAATLRTILASRRRRPRDGEGASGQAQPRSEL
ncbi:MAG: DUF72 domain-containing protein [Verrucomicrobiota bacterium]